RPAAAGRRAHAPRAHHGTAGPVERTLFMVKPDGVARGLVGEIVSRVERRGLSIRAMRLLRVTPEQAAEHYEEHSEKPFYPGLVEFITSGPVLAMVIEGDAAVS